MATSTLTQYNNLGIFSEHESTYINEVFHNNELLGLHVGGQAVFPPSPLTDPRGSYRWNVAVSTGGGAETFNEGAAQPAATASTNVEAALAATYFRRMVRASGHLRDAMRLRPAGLGFDVLDEEIMMAAADVRDLMNTTLMTGTGGLVESVDSGTTYAGIARGSQASWESVETDLSGALTLAAMRDICETQRDNDKAGRLGLILAPHNQLSNYEALVGAPAAANSSFRVNFGPSAAGGGGLDLAADPTQLSFQGKPIVGISDLTDTVILYLDLRPGKFALKVRRPFEVRRDQAGDDDVLQISSAACLVNRQPKRDAKHIGVTA